MSLFYVTPDDRRWMRRRAGLCLRRCTVLLLIFVLMRTGMAVTGDEPYQYASVSESAQITDPTNGSPRHTTETGESATGRSVPPMGWRRTNRGWEKVEWARQYPEVLAKKKTLRQWMQHQADRESQWLAQVSAALCRIPPLGIAALQIFAIWLIARQATPRRVASSAPSR